MIIALLCSILIQEFYYIDGTEFRLKDGTVVKTAIEIEENNYSYFWREEGEMVVLPKTDIKSIHFFSLRVPGRQPKKEFKFLRQRRIPGKKIFYERDDQTLIRFQHVDVSGRNMEGQVSSNLLRELVLISNEPEQGMVLECEFDRVKAGMTIAIEFFNYDGKRLFTAHLDTDGSWSKKAIKKKRKVRHLIETVPGLTLDRIGLVETYSTKKG